MTRLLDDVGRQLGPYTLTRQLGEGAYAQVWQAMEKGDHGFQKKVALKILKESDTTDALAFESLLDEARICGMLHHRHIVDVYSVSQVDGRTFIAMEYVDGATLKDVLVQAYEDETQLPLSVIVEIALGVARALDHAHKARGPDGQPLRVVHRDLKPGNVMIASGAGIKVTDFGLAKATSNQGMTMAGAVRGTPGYIAPEVWGGTRDFAATIDLWALGVMLWEMAVGERMFKGAVFELMAQTLNGDLEPFFGQLTVARPELVPLVRSLLVREPELRCQSAWEVVDKLEAIQRGLDAPGGLDLFVELLGLGNPHDPKGADALRSQATASGDPAWSKLITASALPPVARQELREARVEARKERERAQRPDGDASAVFMQPTARVPLEIWLGVVVVVVTIGLGLVIWSQRSVPHGCVAFSSTPSGATIAVDGEQVGRTGEGSPRAWPEGTLAVTIGEGAQAATVAVLIEAGKKTRVDCTLASGACTLSSGEPCAP